MMSVLRDNRPARRSMPAGVLLLAAFVLASGCSSTNSPGGGNGTSSYHVTASGQSIPGWVVLPSGGSHASAATLDYADTGSAGSCAECHGADLSGGISKVSCFANTAGCHHGPVAGWTAPQNHGATAKRAPGSSGFASCQICHGAGLSGGGSRVTCLECHGTDAPHPQAPWRGKTYTHVDTDVDNAPVCARCHFSGPVGREAGCYNNSMCHGSYEQQHSVPFDSGTHYNVTSATFPSACDECHDVSGTSTKAGPVCLTCHKASPLTQTSCASCHGIPPDGAPPAGPSYPNIAGSHAVHFSLTSAQTPLACATCHNGLGSETLDHYNQSKTPSPPGGVAFQSTYNGKSGSPSFNSAPSALSCSAVSCHGGQATPSWQTGSIDVNNQCTACHEFGTSQHNGYSSGDHRLHTVALGITAATCRSCHNTTTLSGNHFTSLSTPAMEGPASATIGGAGTSINQYFPETGSCTSTCHGRRTW